MPKTVTIDARWLVGGIGTYTRNLLQEFHNNSDGFAVNAIVRPHDSVCIQPLCHDITIIDEPIYTLREQFLIPRASRHSDLLHIPHFNVPLLHHGPLVVSIMDVIHLRSSAYRNNVSTIFYAYPMLHAAVRKAHHIITVSTYSKTEIVDALGVEESRITVIPCGVSAEFSERHVASTGLDAAKIVGVRAPFILYVGNLKPHKNVSTLLRAFADLRHSRKIDHSLLIIGDDSRWKRSLIDECLRLAIRDRVVFVPQVSQFLLPSLYSAANLLVMPSTIEGFGLPVLEAMACGTPVVTSTAASLPEVAGDAALYFDPASPDELAAQIELLIHSSDLRKCLRGKGLERSKRFSWRESARRHAELYCQLLGLN